MMRRRAIVIQVIVMLFLVTAFAAGQEQEKISLHYLTWATTGEEMIREDTIEPFQELYPHIEFEYEAISGLNNFLDKLITYQLSGNVPDLIHVSVGHLYDLADMGLLHNLQPWFDRDLNPDDFFMEVTDAVRYPTQDGDLYAMPFSFIVTPLYYNQTMFDEAGVAPPTYDWTWDNLRDAARRFARDSQGDGLLERWGFWSRNRYDQYDTVVHSFGGRLLSDDYRTAMLYSPEALDATNFMINLMWQDGAAPTPQEERGQGNLLSRGRVAMAIAQINDISTMREHADFDWGVSVLPAGPAQRVVRLWPDSYGIPADAKNKEAAWEYIKFAVQQETMDRYSGERKVPINRRLATSPEWLERDKEPDKMVFIESILYGQPLEFGPAWSAWNNAKTQHLAEAWAGNQDPGIALQLATEAMQRELDRFFEGRDK